MGRSYSSHLHRRWYARRWVDQSRRAAAGADEGHTHVGAILGSRPHERDGCAAAAGEIRDPTSCLLLLTTYYLLLTTYCLLLTAYCLLLTTYYLLLTTYYLLLTTYYCRRDTRPVGWLPKSRNSSSCSASSSLGVWHYSLPTTHYLLLVTHYLLLVTHYLLLATYHLLLTSSSPVWRAWRVGARGMRRRSCILGRTRRTSSASWRRCYVSIQTTTTRRKGLHVHYTYTTRTLHVHYM